MTPFLAPSLVSLSFPHRLASKFSILNSVTRLPLWLAVGTPVLVSNGTSLSSALVQEERVGPWLFNRYDAAQAGRFQGHRLGFRPRQVDAGHGDHAPP